MEHPVKLAAVVTVDSLNGLQERKYVFVFKHSCF